jgi:hypothetical protein
MPTEILLLKRIGPMASDEKLAEAADACFRAAVAIMAVIRNNAVRERALAERDSRTAELIRQVAQILDAAEHGEIQRVDYHSN